MVVAQTLVLFRNVHVVGLEWGGSVAERSKSYNVVQWGNQESKSKDINTSRVVIYNAQILTVASRPPEVR